MRPLLALALALLPCGCAAPDSRAPRAVIALSPRSIEVPPAEDEPDRVEPDAPVPEPVLAPRSRRFEIESAALTRAFGRPRSVGAEVVLPQAFRSRADHALVYHVPDIGEDPAQVADRLAELGLPPGLVLVVLDPRGIRGHHLFVDSVNEGPYGEALVTDLIPVLERHLLAGSSAQRRFVSGVGLGGWSAIRIQLEYAHAFDAAYAFDPDPLDLRAFYGVNLLRALDEGGQDLAILRDERIATRLAAFESAIGARGDDGSPQQLLARGARNVQADVVAAFLRRDPASYVRERGRSIASRLDRKLYAITRHDDALGRDVSLRAFATELAAAGVTCGVRLPSEYVLDESIVGAWASMLALPEL